MAGKFNIARLKKVDKRYSHSAVASRLNFISGFYPILVASVMMGYRWTNYGTV
jgi:hypothetical protein